MIGQIAAGDHIDIFVGVNRAGRRRHPARHQAADGGRARAPGSRTREEAGSHASRARAAGPLSSRTPQTTASSGSFCDRQAAPGPSTPGSSTLRRLLNGRSRCTRYGWLAFDALVALDAGVDSNSDPVDAARQQHHRGRRDHQRSRRELAHAAGDRIRPPDRRLRGLLRPSAVLHRRGGERPARPTCGGHDDGLTERVRAPGLRVGGRRHPDASGADRANRLRAREGRRTAARGRRRQRHRTRADDLRARAQRAGRERRWCRRTSPSRWRWPGSKAVARRPRSPVRRHRAGTGPAARQDHPRPGALRRVARQREARRLPRQARVGPQRPDGADAARPGKHGDRRLSARRVHDASVDVRLRDRRHAPGLHTGGDRRDRPRRPTSASSACSTHSRSRTRSSGSRRSS